MRRILRATIALTAAAGVCLALGGASLSGVADAAVQPHEFAPSFVIPPYHDTAPVPSDAQVIAAAAPERAILAAKAKAAAAAAAAAAAEARADAASHRSLGAVETASVGGRSLNVWTTGFQTQLNDCRGGVDLTAAYHTRTVGEHWSCGGAAFPEAPGATVHITGLDAGTYRVIGVVATLNAYVAHTSNIPHGYAMLFQTCRNGDSHYTIFIALARE
jgi:hypothetical protein